MRTALLTLVLMWTGSVSAQSLPDWAAPSGPTPSQTQAQPPPPPGGGPGGAAPAQVPLDGGLTLLALAGAGYAARKLRQRSA